MLLRFTLAVIRAGKQRSLKIKPAPRPAPAEIADVVGTHAAGELTEQLMPGVIRDERGVWIAPETED